MSEKKFGGDPRRGRLRLDVGLTRPADAGRNTDEQAEQFNPQEMTRSEILRLLERAVKKIESFVRTGNVPPEVRVRIPVGPEQYVEYVKAFHKFTKEAWTEDEIALVRAILGAKISLL